MNGKEAQLRRRAHEEKVELVSCWQLGTPEGDVHTLVYPAMGMTVFREVFVPGTAPIYPWPHLFRLRPTLGAGGRELE